ncbi:hypothetical protein AAG570_013736 [Ranatra chinensis]|uniref:Uncharacterized protein n=1 Tax=Ranatra chinensis TaxID=642074 RepID=A0ABD0YD19_9HEMI
MFYQNKKQETTESVRTHHQGVSPMGGFSQHDIQKGGKLHVPIPVVSCFLFLWNMFQRLDAIFSLSDSLTRGRLVIWRSFGTQFPGYSKRGTVPVTSNYDISLGNAGLLFGGKDKNHKLRSEALERSFLHAQGHALHLQSFGCIMPVHNIHQL